MSAKPLKPALYIFGIPGKIGGASTKIVHLIRLIGDLYRITIVVPDLHVLRDKDVQAFTRPHNVPCVLLKDVPRCSEGLALAICNPQFFARRIPEEAKRRGLKVVWSNEMMFPFPGESEAVKAGLIDRVLFVSEFQKRVFTEMYEGVPSAITGNYVAPEDFPRHDRRNQVFTLGRLSRPDVEKWPLDFPVFYEELGLRDVRYRVMGWGSELQRQYRWHKFGPEWDRLPPNKESAVKFLQTLDVFLYPLGHLFKESWGRAVVEAMLTGCVPIVPTGHQFDKLMVHGQSGFICAKYNDYRETVREMYEDHSFRTRMSNQCSMYAREQLCDASQHRRVWQDALTF